MIENGIDVNNKDNNGRNALRYLCEYHKNENLLDIIQLVIKYGIEVTSETLNYFSKNYNKEDRNEILQLLELKSREMDPVEPNE